MLFLKKYYSTLIYVFALSLYISLSLSFCENNSSRYNLLIWAFNFYIFATFPSIDFSLYDSEKVLNSLLDNSRQFCLFDVDQSFNAIVETDSLVENLILNSKKDHYSINENFDSLNNFISELQNLAIKHRALLDSLFLNIEDIKLTDNSLYLNSFFFNSFFFVSLLLLLFFFCFFIIKKTKITNL